MISLKKKKNKGVQENALSELRQDIVTGEWIVIAKVRAKRPSDYQKPKKGGLDASLKNCPFEDPQKHGNGEPVLLYKNDKHSDWSVQVIPNKYPALDPSGECGVINEEGPHVFQDGKGFHEIIITRDHDKHFALLEKEEVADVMRAYYERFNILKEEECVKYISIFHNHGREAGASLHHPHSQLIAIPVLPSDVRLSLRGSHTFYRRNKKCVHCTMLEWEKDKKERIVFENEHFIAYCPFASRTAFEIQIFPKEHQSNFEEMDEKLLEPLGEALRTSLRRLDKVLDDPSYNFFIHTSPVGGTKKYSHYHWHIEIMPKTAIWAGFELGTGIEISTIEPEEAAKYLRETR